MNTKSRLRNSLVRKLQRLSTDKLVEVNGLLEKIENQLKSKDKTLKLAGTWKELGNDFFIDLTDNLHNNRAADRQIN